MFSELLQEKYICPVIVRKVQDYFKVDEHKRAYEKWYKEKYGKNYQWRDNNGGE